jgi:hypothetical protein
LSDSSYHPNFIIPCFHPHVFQPFYQPMLSTYIIIIIIMLFSHFITTYVITPPYNPHNPILFTHMLSHVINTFIIPCSIPMLSSNVITPCYHPMLTLHINTMYSIRVIILCCTPYYHPILSLYFIILGDLYFSLQLLPCSSRHINSTIFKKNILSILETLYSIGNTGFHVAMKRKWCYSN